MRLDLGRLACARDDQPYVVPIHFAYDGEGLYGLTTAGQKIDWMRSNPRVCLEIDERSSDDRWLSIVVLGRYEELPGTAACERARTHATRAAAAARGLVAAGERIEAWPRATRARFLPHSRGADDGAARRADGVDPERPAGRGRRLAASRYFAGLTNFSVKRSLSPMAAYLSRSLSPRR